MQQLAVHLHPHVLVDVVMANLQWLPTRMEFDAIMAAQQQQQHPFLQGQPGEPPDPRLAAVADPRLAAVADPRLAAVADPRLAAVADPRLAAVADPRLAAVADPRLAAVADPRVAHDPRVLADPRAAVGMGVPPPPPEAKQEPKVGPMQSLCRMLFLSTQPVCRVLQAVVMCAHTAHFDKKAPSSLTMSLLCMSTCMHFLHSSSAYQT